MHPDEPPPPGMRLTVTPGQPTDSHTTAYIKTLRVDIDRSLQHAQWLATDLNRGDGARNVALCITHLEDAKMRLGLALGDIGHKLPEEFRDEAK